MRRLQANIAYLLGIAQAKPLPTHPAAMEPPPDSWSEMVGQQQQQPDGAGPAVVVGGKGEAEERGREAARELREAYSRLKELWPNYKGPVRGQQGQQGRGGQQQQQGQMPAQAQGQGQVAQQTALGQQVHGQVGQGSS